MKFNIFTCLLLVALFAAGFSSKVSAQEWRWRYYAYHHGDNVTDTVDAKYMDYYKTVHPRMYYRYMCYKDHMEKCMHDSKDGDNKDSKCCHHDDWGCYHGGLFGWGWGWHHRWYNDRYYYRGAGM